MFGGDEQEEEGKRMARRDGRVFGGVSRNQGKRYQGCLRVTVTFIGSRYDDASDR